MNRHEVCLLKDLPSGERKIIQIGKRSVGVFNVNGSYYAIKNTCPHQGAELCRGTLDGTMLPTNTPGEYNYALDGQVLRCPWHFWEFDITTGEMIFIPEPYRVKTYDVAIEKPKLEHLEVAVEDDLVVLYF